MSNDIARRSHRPKCADPSTLWPPAERVVRMRRRGGATRWPVNFFWPSGCPLERRFQTVEVTAGEGPLRYGEPNSAVLVGRERDAEFVKRGLQLIGAEPGRGFPARFEEQNS